MKSTIVALLITPFCAISVHSAIITHSFEGTVIEIDGNTVGVANLGDRVEGSFYYSTGIPDSDGSNTFGFYQNIGDLSLAGFEFNFGGLGFASDLNDLHRIAVSSTIGISKSAFAFNWLFDADDNFSDGTSVFSLQTSTSNYFGNDALPTSFVLDDFSSKQIEFNYQGYYVRAQIDSLQSVPEPSQAALLVSGLACLALSRRRTLQAENHRSAVRQTKCA